MIKIFNKSNSELKTFAKGYPIEDSFRQNSVKFIYHEDLNIWELCATIDGTTYKGQSRFEPLRKISYWSIKSLLDKFHSRFAKYEEDYDSDCECDSECDCESKIILSNEIDDKYILTILYDIEDVEIVIELYNEREMMINIINELEKKNSILEKKCQEGESAIKNIERINKQLLKYGRPNGQYTANIYCHYTYTNLIEKNMEFKSDLPLTLEEQILNGEVGNNFLLEGIECGLRAKDMFVEPGFYIVELLNKAADIYQSMIKSCEIEHNGHADGFNIIIKLTLLKNGGKITTFAECNDEWIDGVGYPLIVSFKYNTDARVIYIW